MLKSVVNDLIEGEKVNGKLASDTYGKVLLSLKEIELDLTKSALLRKVQRGSKNSHPVHEVDHNYVDSDISHLEVSNNIVFKNSNPTSEDGICSPSGSDNDEAGVLLSKAGRPKGTTMAKAREDAKKYDYCVNAITYDYSTELTKKEASKQRYVRGFLEDLIEEKRKEFRVTADIPGKTIQSRTRRGNLAPKNRGVTSPLADAEEILVVLCIQMGKIRQPLNVTEGITLVNDMIEGTQMQEALKEFQSVRRLGSNLFELGKAGRVDGTDL